MLAQKRNILWIEILYRTIWECILKDICMRKFIEKTSYSDNSVLNQTQIHPCAVDITWHYHSLLQKWKEYKEVNFYCAFVDVIW